MRLRNEETGDLIYPNDFIRAAERFGIIAKIDRWVIHNTMKQLSERRALWDSIDQVALNVSALSVRQAGFAQYILEQLEHFCLDGRKFCFELTETEALNNFNDTRQFMALLHEKGCTIALDDFGTGYSSLSYLSRLQADTLKLDKSFIDPIPNDQQHADFVASIIQMVKALKLKLVAEGIESEAQFDWFAAQDCDEAQGFFLARPLDFEAFLASLPLGRPQAVIPKPA